VSRAKSEALDKRIIDRGIAILHEQGPSGLSPSHVQAVLDAEKARLSDPETGLVYFATHYGRLYVKGKGWFRFLPNGRPRIDPDTGKSWGWQPQLWSQFSRFYVLLILKARQLGLTYGCSMVALWEGQWHGNTATQQVAVITNKMANSKRLLHRAKAMYSRQPDWLNMLSPRGSAWGTTRMEFANGSSVEAFAGTTDASASEAASVVLVDEVGKIEQLSEVFASLEACADNGGRIIMWGTVREIEGDAFSQLREWAYDCINGDRSGGFTHETPDGPIHIPVYESDSDMMAFIFLPWLLDASRDMSWYERKKMLFKGNLKLFGQEYPGSVEDMFVGAGNGYFDLTQMEAKIAELEKRGEDGMSLWESRDRRGTLLWENEEKRVVKFVPDAGGDVVLHCTDDELAAFLKTRRPCNIGCDCAGDRPDGDYHAASAGQVGHYPIHEDDVMKPETIIRATQLLTIHGYMDADQYAMMLVRAGYFLGTAQLTVEANGVGVAVLKACKRYGYPNIYMRRTKPESKRDKATLVMGYYSMKGTKHVAYGEAERLVRNDFLDIRDIATLGEMMFVRNLGGMQIGAPKPKKDDRSDALTLMVAGFSTATTFEHPRFYEIEQELAQFSVEAILREVEQQKHRRELLGSDRQDFMAGGY